MKPELPCSIWLKLLPVLPPVEANLLFRFHATVEDVPLILFLKSPGYRLWITPFWKNGNGKLKRMALT
jgi:hypothetical protein